MNGDAFQQWVRAMHETQQQRPQYQYQQPQQQQMYTEEPERKVTGDISQAIDVEVEYV